MQKCSQIDRSEPARDSQANGWVIFCGIVVKSDRRWPKRPIVSSVSGIRWFHTRNQIPGWSAGRNSALKPQVPPQFPGSFSQGGFAIDGGQNAVFLEQVFFFFLNSFLVGEPWSRNHNIDCAHQVGESSGSGKRWRHKSAFSSHHVRVFFHRLGWKRNIVESLAPGVWLNSARLFLWCVGELLGPRPRTPANNPAHTHPIGGGGVNRYIHSSRETVCR